MYTVRSAPQEMRFVVGSRAAEQAVSTPKLYDSIEETSRITGNVADDTNVVSQKQGKV